MDGLAFSSSTSNSHHSSKPGNIHNVQISLLLVDSVNDPRPASGHSGVWGNALTQRIGSSDISDISEQRPSALLG
jgi:hypothetical protein